MNLFLLKKEIREMNDKPVAWMNDSTPSGIFARHMEGAKNFGCTIPLYTAPPQRTWVNLTDEEIDQSFLRTNYSIKTADAWRNGVEWAQSQLKEKNT